MSLSARETRPAILVDSTSRARMEENERKGSAAAVQRPPCPQVRGLLGPSHNQWKDGTCGIADI